MNQHSVGQSYSIFIVYGIAVCVVQSCTLFRLCLCLSIMPCSISVSYQIVSLVLSTTSYLGVYKFCLVSPYWLTLSYIPCIGQLRLCSVPGQKMMASDNAIRIFMFLWYWPEKVALGGSHASRTLPPSGLPQCTIVSSLCSAMISLLRCQAAHNAPLCGRLRPCQLWILTQN